MDLLRLDDLIDKTLNSAFDPIDFDWEDVSDGVRLADNNLGS